MDEKYTKEKIIELMVADLMNNTQWVRFEKSDDIQGTDTFYASASLKRKGKTTDTKEHFTEIIGKFLIENGFIEHANFTGIRQLTRNNSYYTKSHEKLEVNDGSNRDEELFVKSLYFHNPFKAELGSPIDYQTPLKDKSSDKAGKIDLLTYKKDTDELFIVEVKADNSEETLLRTVLEVQTYYQTADKEKLIKDFYDAEKITSKNPAIKKAVVIFKGSNPAKEYEENRPCIMEIIEKLGIKICVLDIKVKSK